MTDAPSRPDPLAPDYGSAGNVPVGSRPVAPDPTVDRFSAFDQPDGSRQPATSKNKTGRSRGRNRSQPAPSSPSPSRVSTPTTARAADPRRAPGTSKPPSTARRKATIVFTAVFVALVGIPLVLAAVIALVSNSSGPSSVSEREEREPVAFTPLTVEPSTVPSIPSTVTELRVEIQGSERIADVRLYSDTAVTRLEDTPLPFGATIPITSNDAYVSISASDYGYRGPRAMRCTVYAGDVVLTTSVGTRSVQCNVTDSTWDTGR